MNRIHRACIGNGVAKIGEGNEILMSVSEVIPLFAIDIPYDVQQTSSSTTAAFGRRNSEVLLPELTGDSVYRTFIT